MLTSSAGSGIYRLEICYLHGNPAHLYSTVSRAETDRHYPQLLAGTLRGAEALLNAGLSSMQPGIHTGHPLPSRSRPETPKKILYYGMRYPLCFTPSFGGSCLIFLSPSPKVPPLCLLCELRVVET